MLDFCTTDDELGVVLGHEISHCLLGHAVSCNLHRQMCIACIDNKILSNYQTGWKCKSRTSFGGHQTGAYRSSMGLSSFRYLKFVGLRCRSGSCQRHTSLPLFKTPGEWSWSSWNPLGSKGRLTQFHILLPTITIINFALFNRLVLTLELHWHSGLRWTLSTKWIYLHRKNGYRHIPVTKLEWRKLKANFRMP